MTGGRVKAQWKADWAMRWTALGVDYEMCGKDLIDSVKLSSKICRALGATPPENFIFELFLDEAGGKISKSKGNGLTVDEWLTYASPESLSLFMYPEAQGGQEAVLRRDPEDGRRVPGLPRKVPAEEPKGKLENPVWHIHAGAPPHAELPISFAPAAELVSVSNAEERRRCGAHPQIRGRCHARGAPVARSSRRLRADSTGPS